MKSFNNFYSVLPDDAKKIFKTAIVDACGWNDDQFYKKMRGTTKIWKLESEIILKIAKRFETIFRFARNLHKEVDEVLLNQIF